MRVLGFLLAALALCGCSARETAGNLDVLETRGLIMPDGREIRDEVMISPASLQRGMMFRDALPPGRGMFFMHKDVAAHTYWMYSVKVPLDIVFIDSGHHVLGMTENAPPCRTRASECPSYGGFPGTKYVLEMNGGQAAKYGVATGSFIRF
jgi:uncharacterized protein